MLEWHVAGSAVPDSRQSAAARGFILRGPQDIAEAGGGERGRSLRGGENQLRCHCRATQVLEVKSVKRASGKELIGRFEVGFLQLVSSNLGHRD